MVGKDFPKQNNVLQRLHKVIFRWQKMTVSVRKAIPSTNINVKG